MTVAERESQKQVPRCARDDRRTEVAPKTFHVYILASRSRVLYVGVTSDLVARVFLHRSLAVTGFTARYRIYRLVHFEDTTDAHAAISREKQLKDWRRSKKIALIEGGNPMWQDLAADWFDALAPSSAAR